MIYYYVYTERELYEIYNYDLIKLINLSLILNNNWGTVELKVLKELGGKIIEAIENSCNLYGHNAKDYGLPKWVVKKL